ncbi:MAG: hypothetical protein WCK59_03640 [Candidatus Falkowbacteria bacterium]
MEQFEAYNEQAVKWRKSVSEISKFIIDHLDRPDFYNFITGTSANEEKEEHYQLRLEELITKATKRMGHAISQEKLLSESYDYIINQRDNGVLPPSSSLNHFCENILSR